VPQLLRSGPLRPALFALLLAVAAPSALAAGQDPVADPVQQRELYRSALRAMADGQPGEAAALLERLVAQQPDHAGGWLDLAIARCELGEQEEAQRIFTLVEQRFAPPPDITELIARYRRAGCAVVPPRPAWWQISVGRGYDDNAAQGSADRLSGAALSGAAIALFDPPDPDESFARQPDHFNELRLDYLRPLDGRGTVAQLQIRALRYDRQHDQDINTLLGGVERSWRAGAWRLRTGLLLDWLTLGSQLYRRQGQLQLRLTPPLQPLPGTELAINAAASQVGYPVRPEFDTRVYELGAAAYLRTARSETQLGAGVQADLARRERPGGDRHGWYASAQWYGRLGERWRAELAATYQQRRSKEIYEAGFIDVLRRQHTTSDRAALLYQLRPNQFLALEYRHTRNQENIEQFGYRSRSIQLSWRADNF
jgi:tetratricopeptide (TPR) repeat protein